MRHGRRTNLAGFDLLFKILHGNILPEITAQINQNCVDTFHSVKNSSHVIIVGNLCRPFLTAQSQHFIHKLISKSFPVIIRISHMMRIEITGCSTELGGNRSRFQQPHLLLQTVNKHHHFFSQTSRRSRLSMCFGQHGNIRPVLGIFLQHVDHFLQTGEIHFIQRILDRQRDRCIINILGSQSEMDKFFILLQRQQVEFFFYKIFNSLYIMICHTLDLFNTGSVLNRKLAVDFPQSLFIFHSRQCVKLR